MATINPPSAGGTQVREKPIQVVFKGDALTFLENATKASGTNTSGFLRSVLQLYAALDKYKDPKDHTITIEAPDGKTYKFIMPSSTR